MEIHYDPVGKTVSASVNEMMMGRFALSITPGFAGFVGVGVLDNFVIRRAP